MSTKSSLRSIENKHVLYRGKDSMKKFCKSLKEHASYENEKICYICKGKFKNKYMKDEKYCKVRDQCHYTKEYRSAAHSMCNLKYSAPKKNPIVFIMNQTMVIILSLKIKINLLV